MIRGLQQHNKCRATLVADIHKLLSEVVSINIVNREVMDLAVITMEKLTGVPCSDYEILEWKKIIACAAHSEAWLSPTSEWSDMSQQGPFQGDGYSTSYERERINPNIAEQAIADNVGGAHSLLFRSVEALMHDLIAVLAQKRTELQKSDRSNVILASPNLSKSFQWALKKNTFAFSNQLEIDWTIDQPNCELACFLHEDDFKDHTNFRHSFLKSNSHHLSSSAPSFIIIEASSPWNEIDFLAGPTEATNVILAGIYRLDNRLPSKAAALVFRNYGIGLMQQELTTALEDVRKLGSNIDSLTNWILILWFSGIPFEHVNRSNIPVLMEYNCSRSDLLLKWSGLKQYFKKTGLQISENKGVSSPWHSTIQNLSFHCESRDNGQNPLTAMDIRTMGRWVDYTFWNGELVKEHGEETHNSLVQSIETRINKLSLPLFNANEIACTQSSLLVSSGMGAMRTILHFLAYQANLSMDKRCIIAGASSYFEVQQLIERVTRCALSVGYLCERDTKALISAAISGNTMAMLLEPIANAVKGSEVTRETIGIINSPKDLPVVDLKAIFNVIEKFTWKAPFYLILDISLFGTAFQVANILPSFRLPHNFHIITWSSLQKLHMEGQETATGGAITLYSSDTSSHQQVLQELCCSRQVVGVETTLLDAILLNRVDFSWDAVEPRCQRILNNANLLARTLAENIKEPVIHPALTNHPDHEVWKRNGSLGIPFVLTRINGERKEMFLSRLNKSFIAEGYPCIVARDSFGFSTFSYTELLFGSSDEVLRLSPGDYSLQHMEELVKIVLEVLEYIGG